MVKNLYDTMQVVVQPVDLRWPSVSHLATGGPPNFAISFKIFWVISSLRVLHVSFVMSTVNKMKRVGRYILTYTLNTFVTIYRENFGHIFAR